MWNLLEGGLSAASATESLCPRKDLAWPWAGAATHTLQTHTLQTDRAQNIPHSPPHTDRTPHIAHTPYIQGSQPTWPQFKQPSSCGAAPPAASLFPEYPMPLHVCPIPTIPALCNSELFILFKTNHGPWRCRCPCPVPQLTHWVSSCSSFTHSCPGSAGLIYPPSFIAGGNGGWCGGTMHTYI